MRYLTTLLLISALACGDDDGATDAGADTATPDTSVPDAGDMDTGGDDAGTDAGEEDAGEPDSGPPARDARLVVGDAKRPGDLLHRGLSSATRALPPTSQ